MNFQNELISLQMSGISPLKLSYPIFFIAIILSFISYFNLEVLSPTSSKYIEDFKNLHTRSKKHKKLTKPIHSILLKDNTKLIYQKYDRKNKKLYDVFFIKSIDDIWHIKYLNIKTDPKKGFFVDHFIRENGKLKKKESFDSYDFLLNKIKSSSFDLIENRANSTLFLGWINKNFTTSKEKAEMAANLNYILAIPFFPFLIALSILPICIKFSKKNLFFIITAISLFCYIGFYSFMDSMLILSENRVGSPFFLIWLPIFFSFLYFSFRFLKRSL